MKYCRHCGSEMKDEATVCIKCGVAERATVTAEKAYCRSCGAEMNSAASVCVKCGVDQKIGGTKFNTNFGGGVSTSSAPLTRVRDGKVLAGVCSGLGKKLNMNPWIIRAILIFSNFIVIGWFFDIAYLIAIFAVPYEN